MLKGKTMVKNNFTPKEANSTLPLVKRIVKDILQTGKKIRDMVEVQGEPQNSTQVENLLGELEDYFNELHSIGCSFRDWGFSMGLVDFPSSIEGKDILLCWRSDEEKLEYYHGLHDGYQGRKPIPEKYLI